MSEAELHLLRARLRGGALNKAKRGELEVYLPIGLAYDAIGRVILDPDEQVRQSVQLVFATFQRTGSAFAVVREFRRQGWLFPRHQRSGTDHEQVLWKQLSYPLATKILHNPRYTGAFVYGRTTARKSADGKRGAVRRLPQDQWQVLIKNDHPGYLSWEQYEANLARLRENTARPSTNDRPSAPREGPALLQGLIMCGICGQRMHPRYTARGQNLWPYYLCPPSRPRWGPSVVPAPLRKGNRRCGGRVAACQRHSSGVGSNVGCSGRNHETGSKKLIACDRHKSSEPVTKRVWPNVGIYESGPEQPSGSEYTRDGMEYQAEAADRSRQEYQRQCQSDHLMLNDAQSADPCPGD